MDPLHVVSQLLQILDISVTDFADDKVALPTLALTRLARLHGVGGRGGDGGLLGDPGVVSAGQRGDGDARGVAALAVVLLAQTLTI